VTFFEPLDDRRGLDQHLASINQCRHQALRVERLELGLEVLLGTQIHRQVLVLQAFEVQGDPEAMRGAAAEEVIELHALTRLRRW
jgi:hypothetical protein